MHTDTLADTTAWHDTLAVHQPLASQCLKEGGGGVCRHPINNTCVCVYVCASVHGNICVREEELIRPFDCAQEL